MTKDIHLLNSRRCFFLALFTVALPTAHADLIIDDFQDAQSLGVSGSPTGYQSAFGSILTGSVVGGERDLHVERTSSNGGSISVDIDGSFNDALAFASSPATMGRALLSYDGSDGASALNYAGLSSLDLTNGGLYQGIMLGTTSDLGANITFSIFTDATRYSEATLPILADPTFTFSSYFVRWSDFTSVGPGGGADFTNVGAITVLLDGTTNPGVDIGVNYLASAVPEPSGALLLIGSGFLLFAGRRRSA